MRLINKLCPLGKVFHKHLWNQCKTKKRHFAYGYTKGRRREQAILIQSQTSCKLRNLGINHTKSMRDIANAFPSIAHNSLNDMLDKVTDPRSARFLQHRHRHSYMVIQQNSGECTIIKPGCGGCKETQRWHKNSQPHMIPYWRNG